MISNYHGISRIPKHVENTAATVAVTSIGKPDSHEPEITFCLGSQRKSPKREVENLHDLQRFRWKAKTSYLIKHWKVNAFRAEHLVHSLEGSLHH